MNKKLMVIAIASALAAPGLAVAQIGGSPGVSVYGRLDTAILNDKFATTPTNVSKDFSKGDVFSAGNSLGFRGREDLGGGTSAWFQLEQGVWPDGRLDAAATTGAQLGGRNSGVGVTSSMGDIMWGGWDSPYKVTTDSTYNVVNSGPFSGSGIILGNGDTTGALPSALCQTTLSNTSGSLAVVAPATSSCVTEASGNTTSFHRRNNNTVQYWSPVFAGLQFKLATAMANYQSNPGAIQGGNATQKPKLYSGNVIWARGPFLVTAAYEIHGGFRANNTVNAVADPQDKAMQIGGRWDFGIGQVGVGLEKLSYADTRGTTATAAAPTDKMDVSAQVVNARFNAGPGAVWAGYTRTPGGKGCTQPSGFNSTTGAGNLVIGNAACGSAGSAKMLALGYDYVLSKRTKLYLAYAKIDNGISSNYYYIAGPASNNPGGNGTASGVLAGTDVTTYGFGMQHSF